MELTKVQIGLLEGKTNWSTWKYKMCILLRGISGALEVVEGKLVVPTLPSTTATSEQKSVYETHLATFTKADTNALLVLTTNMTEDTLQKVMRFTTAREVWLELYRLYDGKTEDKTYDLCLQFFSYKRQPGDDIASHTSKLKNLWNDLQVEITKEKLALENRCTCNLPELLLICKILHTLPEEYFSFKASWMLMAKSERTVDSLTNQLCVYEKSLFCKQESNSEEVLAAEKGFTRKGKFKPKKNIICNYCKQAGHKVRQCAKWKADGKPPKPECSIKRDDRNVNVTLLM